MLHCLQSYGLEWLDTSYSDSTVAFVGCASDFAGRLVGISAKGAKGLEVH